MDKKTDLKLIFDSEKGLTFKNGENDTIPDFDLVSERINKLEIEEALNGGFAIRVSYNRGIRSDLLVVETREDLISAIGLLFRERKES